MRLKTLEVRVHSIPLVPAPERFPENVILDELGLLEQRMFAAVEALGNPTVAELLEYTNRSLAYSTIKTTLDRLVIKGMLNREVEEARSCGRKRLRYGLRYSKEEREREATKVAIATLLSVGNSAKVSLSYLVDVMCEHDISILTELERVLEEKRRQSKSGNSSESP